MPKISVLTTTYNNRYLKDQERALQSQTLTDYEWIVVDDHYEENKGLIKAIHLAPLNPVPYFAKAGALNDGLIHASGEIVYFMNDYVIPEKRCLERHWTVQQKLGGIMLAGRALKVDVIPTDETMLTGQDYRMALFDNGFFKWTSMGDDLFEVPRAGIQNWMNGRNDSCPLAPLLECNGFDEAFDGAWGGEDADMANRLMTFGLHFFMDKRALAFELPHISGNKKAMRTNEEQMEFQFTIINPRVKRGIYTANKNFLIMLPRDLKEERCHRP